MKKPTPQPKDETEAAPQFEVCRPAPPGYRPPRNRKKARSLFPVKEPDWTFKSE